MTTIVCDPSVATCDAAHFTRKLVFDEAVEQVRSDTDALGRTYSYDYDLSGRLTRAAAPEGNFTTWVHDGYGNVIQTIATPKGSSADGCGDAGVLCATAAYDDCPGPTCASPTHTTDPRGATTDYGYDPAYGVLTRVTAPAPTAGAVRPETRYEYADLQAYYLNGGGVMAASGLPIHLPVKVSACRTTGSCADGADETRTVMTYDDGGGATVGSNLDVLAVASGSGDGGLTATTTMASAL